MPKQSILIKETSCIETLHEIESDSDLSTFLYTLYKNQTIRLTLTLIGVVMKLARLIIVINKM